LFVTSFFFFSSRRRHTRSKRDWSSDVCSSDLTPTARSGVTLRPEVPSASTAVAATIVGTPPKSAPHTGTASTATTAPPSRSTAKIGRASCRERGEDRERADESKKNIQKEQRAQ